MRLISLSTSIQSIGEICFKEELNIVQLNPYNGSKYLLVELIHFCYGGRNVQFSQDKELSVTLIISNDEEVYTISRNTKNIQCVNLNGTNYKLREYKQKLGELFFGLPNNTTTVSFRSLIPFFIRPSNTSHSDSFNPNGNKFLRSSDIIRNNFFLFGVGDELENRIDKLEKVNYKYQTLIKARENNSSEVIFDKKNLEIQLSIIEDNLKKNDLSNYYLIKEESDKYSSKIEKKQNELIQLIKKSDFLKSRIEVKIGQIRVEEVYKDIRLNIDDHKFKSLDEVVKFSNQICINRKRYLRNELKIIENNISKLGREIEECKNEQRKLLKHLGASDTFSIFLKQVEYMSFLKGKRNEITEKEKLVELHRGNRSEIENLKSKRKEINNSLEIKKLNKMFTSFLDCFFPNHNDMIFLSRRMLKYKNDDMASVTYNHIRTFCYELTLLFSQTNNHINCIVKRDPVFDNLPSSVIEKLINLLITRLANSKKQYILILELDESFIQSFKQTEFSINWI